MSTSDKDKSKSKWIEEQDKINSEWRYRQCIAFFFEQNETFNSDVLKRFTDNTCSIFNLSVCRYRSYVTRNSVSASSCYEHYFAIENFKMYDRFEKLFQFQLSICALNYFVDISINIIDQETIAMELTIT